MVSSAGLESLIKVMCIINDMTDLNIDPEMRLFKDAFGSLTIKIKSTLVRVKNTEAARYSLIIQCCSEHLAVSRVNCLY